MTEALKPPLDFAARTDFLATLRALTPLHVGSGVRREDERLKVDSERGEPTEPEVARIVVDGAERPYIPGATLKGALRARLEAALARIGEASASADELLGSSHDDTGNMSALIVYGARFVSVPAGGSELPAYDKTTGVALSARTKIDGGRGVVDRHKLFHAEETTPGVAFKFHMRLLEPADSGRKDAVNHLLALLLHELAATELALGRSRADGAGRLEWADKRTSRSTLESDGRLREGSPSPGWLGFTLDAATEARFAKAARKRTLTLTLKADGPFFVNDWWWAQQAPERKRQAKDRGGPKARVEEPQLRALRRSAARPELPGQSLMGALRARATWLALREQSRANDESRAQAFDKANVDSLFGTTERKARLRLRALTGPQFATAMRAASVKLDRLAHGPMDSALFDAETFVGCEFVADFEFARDMDVADEQLCEALWTDVENAGLTLGHAGNRGFGWFLCKRGAAP